MRHPILQLLPIIAISTDTTIYLTITTLWPLSSSLLCTTITISLHQPTLYKWAVPIHPPGPMPSVVKPWHCNGAPPGAEGGGATVSWSFFSSVGNHWDQQAMFQIKCYWCKSNLWHICNYVLLVKRVFCYNTAYFLQKFLKPAILIYISLFNSIQGGCLPQ